MEGDGLDVVRAVVGGIGGAGHGSWDRVCVACAEALSVTGVGIVLLAGDDQPALLGISDEVEGIIEEAQFTLGEGPGVDAGRHGFPVHEPDLAVAGRRRWPAFTIRALDAGAAAVFALPLQVGAARVGALNLYRDRPGPLSREQLTAALAVSDLVTRAVLNLQAGAATGALAAELADVPFRAVVHQATGMIAAQLGVAVGDALVRLRAFAYAEDRSVDEVAALVVARTLRFDDSPTETDRGG